MASLQAFLLAFGLSASFDSIVHWLESIDRFKIQVLCASVQEGGKLIYTSEY